MNKLMIMLFDQCTFRTGVLVRALFACTARRYKGDVEKLRIYLTSPDVELRKGHLGEDQARAWRPKYPATEVVYHQLDIADQSSVDTFSSYLKETYVSPCIQILLNNAGCWANSGPNFNFDIARKTMDINYYGTKRVKVTSL